jgi:uncharacterized phage infection (PIP) family protein YhgE
MPNIGDLNIRNIDVGIGIRNIPNVAPQIPQIPTSLPTVPSITNIIGTPIMEVPGCVEARENNNKDLPLNDKRGNMVLCDGSMPSYKAMDYNPNDLTFSRPQVIPPKLNPKKDEQETKQDALDAVRRASQINTAVVEDTRKRDESSTNTSPAQTTTNVGDTLQLSDPIVDYLPSPAAVTTTATIAVVATTSALLAKPLADFLLKLVKPTVKKVIAKLQKIRGKGPPRESVRERRISQRGRNRVVSDLTKTVKELKRGLK